MPSLTSFVAFKPCCRPEGLVLCWDLFDQPRFWDGCQAQQQIDALPLIDAALGTQRRTDAGYMAGMYWNYGITM